MDLTVPAPVQQAGVPALIVTPHPVSLAGQRVLSAAAAQFEPGDTLAVLLARQGVLPGQQWVVTIGGVVVPEQHWARVRPKHGHLIECRRVPEKGILRIVAIAALSYFTLGAGGIGGGSFLGFTGVAGKVLAYGAFLGGSLVINKLLAPKVPGRNDQSVSPTYSLQAGGRNRARLYEPMGLVLGEPYAVPDIGAQPYTYFAGNQQYLWQVFHLGINCADATSLRIGQTPLSVYQGVTTLRNGLESGNSDFPALGGNVDSTAGAALLYNTYVTRTSGQNTVLLAIDLVASLFAINQDTGAFAGRTVNIEAEYREVGAGAWLPFTDEIPGVPAVTEEVPNLVGESQYQDGTITRVITPGVAAVPAGVIRLRNATQRPLRVTYERSVAPGQYEVRLRNLNTNVSGSAGANQVEWVQLRSFGEDTSTYDGQARLAIQIRASGQLNGALDELNAVLKAKPMPYWNGSAWVDAVDRASGLCNPGAIFLLIARGIYDGSGRRLAGLGLSDSQIDIEGLQLFMQRCAAMGFEFDLFLQEAMSTEDLLEALAYAGMGERSYRDGKLGVTFFTEDDPIEGVINMANIRARSFGVDYETAPTADELEFQYFDRNGGNTWRSLRVRAPGVTNPRSTARQPLTGITSEAHAALLARFAMAQNVYLRKTISCELDLEYMTFRRGAVVALSHDLTQWGYGGRLVAVEDNAGVITLTLDEPVPATNPTGGPSTRYIGLRLPGETQLRAFAVQSFTGESRVLVLDEPWPSGVDLPGADPANPAHDTVWIYDFKAVPGQRLRVVAIEPSGNGARLTLVPESVEFWGFVLGGEYEPPPNNSLLRPAPVVTGVVVTEQLARQGNTFFTELSLVAEVDGAFQRAELWGAIDEDDEQPELRLVAQSQSQTLSWIAGLDERWHLELRVFSESRQATPYRLQYDVQGLRQPPPDVQEITVTGDMVSWPAVNVPDLAGYELRFQFGNNTWWDTAVPLHTGVITESPYQLTRRPQGDVTVLIKAVDTTGNRSENAASVQVGFAPIPVSNAVFSAPQHPGFEGDITGGSIDGDDLVADDLDLFYEPATGPMYTPGSDPMYGTSQYGEMVYGFTVSSTQAGRLVLLYTISAESLLVEYRVRGSDPLYEPTADPMYEPTDESLYGEFGDWSVWPGSIDFSGEFEVEFRLTLSGGLVQGVIYDLTAVIDAREIAEELDDVPIGSSGTRLPLTNTYSVIKTVQLTVQNDGGPGVSARVVDKNTSLGPLVEVLNSSGTPVVGVVDARIRGY